MAWNVKVAPQDVVVASVAARFTVELEKGTDGGFVLTFFDEDGLPFGNGRPRSLTLAPDGVTLTDVDRRQQLNWTPPKDNEKAYPAAIATLTANVQAMIDQGLVAPRR